MFQLMLAMRTLRMVWLAVLLPLISVQAHMIGTYNIRYANSGDVERGDVFNVHFDHRGVQARLESARLVLKKIKKISGDQPTLLTGDFNVDQTSAGYRTLVASGELADAYETALIRYALNGTANAFDPNAKTDSRIDHIFLSRHFKALRYGVLTDSYRAPAVRATGDAASANFPKEVKFREYQARLPSDHFPVLIEVSF